MMPMITRMIVINVVKCARILKVRGFLRFVGNSGFLTKRKEMSNLYRVYPVLWDNNQTSQTVYAIDRTPASIPTSCSSRPRADPACTWESPTFQRLLPPTNVGCCVNVNAVTWSSLPAWISYIQTLGYSLAENTSLGKLKPYGDLYIVGP
jgi:hypothetical protein